jgi:hypothetical protein
MKTPHSLCKIKCKRMMKLAAMTDTEDTSKGKEGGLEVAYLEKRTICFQITRT